MLLGRKAEPFDAPDCFYELKFDGFRSLAVVRDGDCQLISRNGNTFKAFDGLRTGLPSDLRVRYAVLDGEIAPNILFKANLGATIKPMNLEGRCALCRELKPLCDSHYIPTGLYRLARTEEKRSPHPVLISRNAVAQAFVPKQGTCFVQGMRIPV